MKKTNSFTNMKKLIIIAISILCSTISIAEITTKNKKKPLNVNSKYISELSTGNIVFDNVYKNFINDYNENVLELQSKIRKNNEKFDMPVKQVYLKSDDIIKNHKFSGKGDYLTELNNSLSNYSYEIKRVSKLKIESQQKEIDLFLNQEIKNYSIFLKNSLNEYDIDNQEKEFISLYSKKIIEILKVEIDTNNNYSKEMLIDLNKNISSYETIQYNYADVIKDLNYKVDNKIFEIIWPLSRSRLKPLITD